MSPMPSLGPNSAATTKCRDVPKAEESKEQQNVSLFDHFVGKQLHEDDSLSPSALAVL